MNPIQYVPMHRDVMFEHLLQSPSIESPCLKKSGLGLRPPAPAAPLMFAPPLAVRLLSFLT